MPREGYAYKKKKHMERNMYVFYESEFLKMDSSLVWANSAEIHIDASY